MEQTSNHYILILCGGSGPRLWPLSRASKPKQFLKIFNQKSLLSQTIDRFTKFIPKTNIFIISHKKYSDLLRQEIGTKIPSKNILLEPEKKNTAMAIIYGSYKIFEQNPQAIITTAPADHFVGNQVKFEKDLLKAGNLASKSNKIIALGTPATSPNPAYGYILPHQFIEKPDIKTATKLILQNALWNCGIYTFVYETIEKEIAKLQPKYYSLLLDLKQKKSLSLIYKNSLDLSFDVAISEKTSNLKSQKINFAWSDVGEWKSIYQKLPKNESGIATISQSTQVIQYNSSRCLVETKTGKLVGLVGVSDLAVIDTVDGLLICNIKSEDSYNVRELVKEMVSETKLKKYFLTK